MNVFHDSRDEAYRSPYGALELGTRATIALEVHDTSAAEVMLRTWVEGEGERRYSMLAVQADEGFVRYEVSYEPEAAGVVWYHFIITMKDGSTWRYGAAEGRRGGVGVLCEWEPPSFQLTVYSAEAPLACEEHALANAVVRFMRNEITAPALVEEFEVLRENVPAAVFNQALSGFAAYSHVRLYADLAVGAPGSAKGRLWCASLVQQLFPPAEAWAGEGEPLGAGARDDLVEAAEGVPPTCVPYDGDCEVISENAVDVRVTFSPIEQPSAPFAANDDVFGFWRGNCCVLVNASLDCAHDAFVPVRGEAVSEVIDGYEVPIVDGHAQVRLRPLGSAILYFHAQKRLQRSMEPGLGVLAHVTSVPTGGARTKGVRQRPGTLGAPARAFVDWLADAGVRYWQVLPVNPTDMFGSPYAGISAFAGNTQLLADSAPDGRAIQDDEAAAYRAFCERESDWLEPYAAFMAIRESLGAGKAWQQWPAEFRTYSQELVDRVAADEQLSASVERWRQAQFAFECQWKDLRAYANERGVSIVGDMPIYVSADSADVWANPGIFQLGSDGMPRVVAGCPPDRFAADGQVWGNPVYDWDVLRQDGYAWWLRRLERAFGLYDYVRLDHFIGFARYYSIPAGEKGSAGSYHPGPGIDFFEKAFEQFGPLPLIAEDLGTITPAVRALGSMCGFPGMDIVQFVDGNDPLSGYVPRPEKIVYTGTHDNDTLVGYCAERYPHLDSRETAEALIDKAITCSADVVVLPLQDVLGLGSEARMNTPGTAEGNWTWQAAPCDVIAASKHLGELVNDIGVR